MSFPSRNNTMNVFRFLLIAPVLWLVAAPAFATVDRPAGTEATLPPPPQEYPIDQASVYAAPAEVVAEDTQIDSALEVKEPRVENKKTMLVEETPPLAGPEAVASGPAAEEDPVDDTLETPDPALSVKRRIDSLKTIVETKPIVEHLVSVEDSMTLSEFLERELGDRFHPREAWAGHDDDYAPQPVRRRQWKPIGVIRHLTIHHAEGVPNEHPAHMIRLIYRGHTNPRGRLDAADVGYHFFIDRNGGIWEGRDARMMGTHVGSEPDGLNNLNNLGICGLGSFSHEYPPTAMVEGAIELCHLLSRYYGRPLGVRGHRDWVGINRFNPRGGIDCPGRLEGAVQRAQARIHDEFGLAAAE